MFVYIRKARRGRNQKSENGYTEYNSSIGKNRTTYSVYMCYESTLSELDSKPTQFYHRNGCIICKLGLLSS